MPLWLYRPLMAIVLSAAPAAQAVEIDRTLQHVYSTPIMASDIRQVKLLRLLPDIEMSDDRLLVTIGLPQAIVMGNGPEFAGPTLDAWAYAHGVTLRFIRPGKPIENAYVESFNGKFRDECLGMQWFKSRADARVLIEDWRKEFNAVRPHASLGQLTPLEFARKVQATEQREAIF